jgi:hypothetical protein
LWVSHLSRTNHALQITMPIDQVAIIILKDIINIPEMDNLMRIWLSMERNSTAHPKHIYWSACQNPTFSCISYITLSFTPVLLSFYFHFLHVHGR